MAVTDPATLLPGDNLLVLTYDYPVRGDVNRYMGAAVITVIRTIRAQASPLSPERGPDPLGLGSQVEKERHASLYTGSCCAVPAIQVPL